MRTDLHTAKAQKVSIQRGSTPIDEETSIVILVFFESQWLDVVR
jgi:hypothetical protein